MTVSGFPDIFQLPYFWTAERINGYIRDASNNRQVNKTVERLDQIDIYHNTPINSLTRNWKEVIAQNGDRNSEGKTNYDEMMIGSSRKTSYDGEKPSDLIRFIRNIDQHCGEKIESCPGGFVDTQLYKNGHDDKVPFIQYWINLFPNLIGALWAVKSDRVADFAWNAPGIPDQVVTALFQARNDERNNGRLIQRFECTTLSESIPFTLEIYLMEGWSVCGVVAKCCDSLVVTQSNGDVLSYILKKSVVSSSFIVGLDNLSMKCISSLVVLLVTPDEVSKVKECVSKWTTCVDKPLGWTDISEEAQKNILAEGNIVIQENKYPVRSVEDLEGHQLNSLLKDNEIALFAQNNLTDEVDLQCYVPRWIEYGVFTDKCLFENQDCVFLIIRETRWGWGFPSDMAWLENRCVEIPDLMAWEQLVGQNIVTTPGPANYDQYYDKMTSLSGGRHVIMLKYERTKPIGGPQDYGEHYIPYMSPSIFEVGSLILLMSERDLIKITLHTKHMFIYSDPGDGKTSLLKSIKRSVNIRDTCVIHTSAKQISDRIPSSRSVTNTIISCLARNKFEESILESMNLVLLLDAVDEVDGQHTPTMEQFLKDLLKTENLRAVITIRSYLMPHLGEKLQTNNFFKLTELSIHQESFIVTRTWELTQGDMSEEIGKAVNIYLGTFRAKLTKLTPLLCKMLALFCIDLLKNDKLDGIIELSLLDLYEHILNVFFKRYVVEKNLIPDTLIEQDIFQVNRKDYILTHVILAAEEMHPGVLQSVPVLNVTPGQGFLANRDPIRFTHRTFAEYFLDRWVFQVLTGAETAESNEFHELFKSRYIGSSNHQFLESMLEQGTICTFQFRPESFDIVQLTTNWLKSIPRTIAKMLITSFLVYSKESFTNLVQRHRNTDVFLPRAHRGEKGLTVRVLSLLMTYSAQLGYFDLLRFLIEEINVEFHPVKLESTHFPTLLHAVLHRSIVNNNVQLNEKKDIIDYLMKSDPNMIHVEDMHDNTCFLAEHVSFELLAYIVDKFDKHTRTEFLTNSNAKRENILHRNNWNFGSVEFMCKFQSKYPAEFYQNINSFDYGENVPWMIMQIESGTFSADVLRQIDFCLLRPSFGNFVNRKDFFEMDSQLRDASNNAQVCIHVDSWVARYPPSDQKSLQSFSTHEHSHDDWFEFCVPHYVQSCLSTCKVSGYVFEGLKERPNSKEFQTFFINEVLAVDGIAFKHNFCCYHINKFVGDVPNSFQLTEELVSSMCVNDSPFIVACKTGHKNIAKFLLASFTGEWIRCLNDFETLCFFRALEHHCVPLLHVIVRKLEAEDYHIPALPVVEALKTGNLRLLKIYMENFHFNGREYFGKNRSTMLHVLARNSMFDQDAVLDGKDQIIYYYLHKFPASLYWRDNLWRVPLMEDRVADRLKSSLTSKLPITSLPERKSLFQRTLDYLPYLRRLFSWISTWFNFH